jgi:hypothetical protein
MLLFRTINTAVKIQEVAQPMTQFAATVRVVFQRSAITAHTTITADSMMSARALLSHIYGAENVQLVSLVPTPSAIGEQTKTLSASELQVKSMSDRAKQLNQQAQQLKARQSLARAQQAVAKASKPTLSK